MQLKDWMKEKGFTPADMARILDTSYHAMYNVLRGGEPSLTLAAKIIKLTGGLVKLEDLAKGDRKRGSS